MGFNVRARFVYASVHVQNLVYNLNPKAWGSEQMLTPWRNDQRSAYLDSTESLRARTGPRFTVSIRKPDGKESEQILTPRKKSCLSEDSNQLSQNRQIFSPTYYQLRYRTLIRALSPIVALSAWIYPHHCRSLPCPTYSNIEEVHWSIVSLFFIIDIFFFFLNFFISSSFFLFFFNYYSSSSSSS